MESITYVLFFSRDVFLFIKYGGQTFHCFNKVIIAHETQATVMHNHGNSTSNFNLNKHSD